MATVAGRRAVRVRYRRRARPSGSKPGNSSGYGRQPSAGEPPHHRLPQFAGDRRTPTTRRYAACRVGPPEARCAGQGRAPRPNPPRSCSPRRGPRRRASRLRRHGRRSQSARPGPPHPERRACPRLRHGFSGIEAATVFVTRCVLSLGNCSAISADVSIPVRPPPTTTIRAPAGNARRRACSRSAAPSPVTAQTPLCSTPGRSAPLPAAYTRKSKATTWPSFNVTDRSPILSTVPTRSRTAG